MGRHPTNGFLDGFGLFSFFQRVQPGGPLTSIHTPRAILSFIFGPIAFVGSIHTLAAAGCPIDNPSKPPPPRTAPRAARLAVHTVGLEAVEFSPGREGSALAVGIRS